MSDRSSRRASKNPNSCIFCGRAGVTAGHFWPGWAMRAAKIKAGEADKSHPVCKKCHSEWISGLEAAAEATATSLIQGNTADIAAEAQSALARWIVLKVMEAEQGQPADAIFPQQDRNALKVSGSIPPYVTIWITRCTSAKWRNAYASPAAIVGPATEPAPAASSKNAQTAALGIGELFAYVVICRAETVDLNDYIMFQDPVMRLWPLAGGDIAWPPPAAIQDREADAISLSLATLIEHPNVKLKARAA